MGFFGKLKERLKSGVASAVSGVAGFQQGTKSILEEIPIYNEAFGSAAYEKADATLRHDIAGKLLAYKELTQQAEQVFVRKNMLLFIGKTEPVQLRLDRIAMKLRAASFAIIGIGTGFKPSDAQLDELKTVDAALLQLVSEIQARLTSLREIAQKSPDTIEDTVFAISEDLDIIESSFEERTTIFRPVS
jgi:hypothetical protein